MKPIASLVKRALLSSNTSHQTSSMQLNGFSVLGAGLRR